MLTATHVKSFIKHGEKKNIQSNQSIFKDILPVTVISHIASNSI